MPSAHDAPPFFCCCYAQWLSAAHSHRPKSGLTNNDHCRHRPIEGCARMTWPLVGRVRGPQGRVDTTEGPERRVKVSHIAGSTSPYPALRALEHTDHVIG